MTSCHSLSISGRSLIQVQRVLIHKDGVKKKVIQSELFRILEIFRMYSVLWMMKKKKPPNLVYQDRTWLKVGLILDSELLIKQ